LRDGAARARPEIRDAIARWIELDVTTAFRDRVLPVTVDILTEWLALARLLAAAGQPRPAADLLLAATARVHKLTVVTRNERDFAGTGVAFFNPWTGQTHVTQLSPRQQ
jgi:predicted nucleic acid-binding protein